MRARLAALIAAAVLPTIAQAEDVVVSARRDAPFRAPPVADPVLATMRGGVLLPNGLQLAIGIDIQTRVDGNLVLHTIYASDGPIIGPRVFTDGADGQQLAPGTVTVRTPDVPGTPIVSVARTPGGPQVVASSNRTGATVNLVTAPPAFWVTAEGQTSVPVTSNGPPVTTGPGSFALTEADGTITSSLKTASYEVFHLIGRVTGSAVTNMGSDRAIDTISSVNLDLQGGLPVLLPGVIENALAGSDAVRGR